MKKSSYEKTTYLAKVRRLRILAEDSLRGWPLKIKRLEFIKLSANAIFKVTDSRNRKYQLRINPDNYHTKPALMEEITWLNHIIKSTDIIVPKPIANNLDDYVTEGLHPSMPSKRLCVLFEWLPGKTRWHSINKDYAYTLGALIGQLQKNGKSIPIKHRRYWDADGLVGTNKAKFYNVEKLSSATPREQKVITEARRRSYRKLKDYEQTYLEKVGLIHGDMQPNNILIYKNH